MWLCGPRTDRTSTRQLETESEDFLFLLTRNVPPHRNEEDVSITGVHVLLKQEKKTFHIYFEYTVLGKAYEEDLETFRMLR